ncbi:MAG: hypothetical protein J6Y37_16215 [Paludibacteraceae bacterium]|nr:hypothetical protein [Paludibacteraceae bacterium]
MWQEGTELIIKESKLARFQFPACIFFFWASISGIIYFDSGYDKAMLFSGLVVLGISILWVLFREAKKPIIISKEGIRLAEVGLIEWNEIEYTYFKSRKAGKNNSNLFLIIEGRFRNREYKINDYAHDEKDFRSAVNYWSGREIGSLYDKNKNSIFNQMATQGTFTKEEVERLKNRYEEYRPLFKKEIEKENIVSIFVLAAVLAVVFLVMKNIISDTLKSRIISFILFPTGIYSLFCLVVSIITQFMRKRFQKKPEIVHLPPTELAQFFKIIERENSPSNIDESKYKIAAIICGLIAIACIAVHLLGL